MDDGESVILILLDLSAAFDTISHPLLAERLSMCGIRGSALKWLTTFLADRYQTVTLGSFCSSKRLLDKGVPQGSCLSLTLFNIYLAPLAKIVQPFGFEIISYADDTQLFSIGSNVLEAKL